MRSTQPTGKVAKNKRWRETRRGADGQNRRSRSDGHAGLLQGDGIVGGWAGTGFGGLLGEKAVPWPAQDACANLTCIRSLYINDTWRFGYGSARYEAELSVASSVEASVSWVKRKPCSDKRIDWARGGLPPRSLRASQLGSTHVPYTELPNLPIFERRSGRSCLIRVIMGNGLSNFQATGKMKA